MNYIVKDFSTNFLDIESVFRHQINIETITTEDIPYDAENLSPLNVGYQFTENDTLYCVKKDGYALKITCVRPGINNVVRGYVSQGRDINWIAYRFKYDIEKIKKMKEEMKNDD